GLPDSPSYTRYADLEREAAVWNVVATPRFDLTPKTWCYPLVGCLAYRGFFDRDRADAVAAALSAQGLDAAVFPVPAYSTLGWFADPVLNTMLSRGEAWLAGLIFHELAHEKLFVRGETAFSEGYAVAVERIGVERWLSARDDSAALARWHKEQALQADFTAELMAARERLGSVYGSGLAEEDLEVARAAVFADLRARVSALDERAGDDRFSRWAAREINNAHLALVATYESTVAGFMRLLRACKDDLTCFHERVAALARADAATRQRVLSDTGES
ncbi:MAG: aminopeptidase, partial [Wenzhouxiangella sp.]